jgi:ABC-type sugar transport system substrate-binding protein
VKGKKLSALLLAMAVLAAALLVGCGSSSSSSSSSETTAAESSSTGSEESASEEGGAEEEGSSGGSPMEETLAFIESKAKPSTGPKIAYLAECTTNPYCQSELEGMEDAASFYGAELMVFDSNFETSAQLEQTQTAIQQGFDGYVFEPVAESSGCADFELLQASGKPVVSANSPMCGDPDYTEGTVGFVAMQTEAYFVEMVENAFASCKAKCQAMAVGGFVGTDLFTRWENAIEKAGEKYPNVEVVSDQAGEFDPRVALQKTQDALGANPEIELVVSSWDDMTRGVEQAVTAAGEQPGKDVRIYSVGGTKEGVGKVLAGSWNETTVLLPYEESYYAFAQLMRVLTEEKETPGFTNLAEAPPVVKGPGTIFLTKENASKFKPEY